MLQGYRWTLDSCSYHVHCTDTHETELDLLSLQRQPEDVRPTLGVSDHPELGLLFTSISINDVTGTSRIGFIRKIETKENEDEKMAVTIGLLNIETAGRV